MLQEIESLFTNFHERYWKRHRKEYALAHTIYPIVQSANGKTDGSGNLDLKVWQNTLGRNVAIGRVFLWADGYTPAAPFSGGWGAIYSGPGFDGIAAWDFLPASSGGQLLPNVATYSGHNAISLRLNEAFFLHLISGPTNTNVSATIYGYVDPIGENYA